MWILFIFQRWHSHLNRRLSCRMIEASGRRRTVWTIQTIPTAQHHQIINRPQSDRRCQSTIEPFSRPLSVRPSSMRCIRLCQVGGNKVRYLIPPVHTGWPQMPPFVHANIPPILPTPTVTGMGVGRKMNHSPSSPQPLLTTTQLINHNGKSATHTGRSPKSTSTSSMRRSYAHQNGTKLNQNDTQPDISETNDTTVISVDSIAHTQHALAQAAKRVKLAERGDTGAKQHEVRRDFKIFPQLITGRLPLATTHLRRVLRYKQWETLWNTRMQRMFGILQAECASEAHLQVRSSFSPPLISSSTFQMPSRHRPVYGGQGAS